jgi:O-Antigen ligase
VIYGQARRIRGDDVALGAFVAFCCLLLIYAFHSPIEIMKFPLAIWASLAAFLLPAAILAIRFPVATACAFIAFTPFNRFAIMLVYHFSGSATITKGFQLWKEALLGAIIVRLVFDLAFTRNRGNVLRFMDILVLGFIGIGMVYLIYPGPVNIDVYTRFEGLRSDTEMLVAYYAGRGLQLNRRKLRWILLSIVPGSVLVGLVALWQFVSPESANSVFNALGYPQFVAYQGMLGDFEAVRTRDIPGADTLPRASSLLLSDLALSFFQVYTVALAAAMFFCARKLRDTAVQGAFLALMFTTLVVTLSRSAIMCSAGALLGTVVFLRRPGRFAILGVVGVGLLLFVVTTGFVHLTTIEAMVNFQDPSSLQHQADLQVSLQAIKQYPFGRGIGTAGNVGQQQLGSAGITNESWYLQLGTEMGVWTMVLYGVLVALVALMGLWNYLKVTDYWLRVLCLTMAGSAAAMFVLGNFLHAWENTPLSIVFWLLAGILWRAPQLEASPEYWEEA